MEQRERNSRRKTRAPGWLIGLIGVDFFGHVTYVFLDHATDTSIGQIGRLSQLEKLHLNLDGASVKADGFAHLKRLTKLSCLSFGGREFSGVWLAQLSGWTSLSHLDLGHTQVSDDSLAHLSGLPNLSTLSLNETHVTDAGLAHLKNLTNLSTLDISKTQVTDDGMRI